MERCYDQGLIECYIKNYKVAHRDLEVKGKQNDLAKQQFMKV